MTPLPPPLARPDRPDWDLFCRVIDNHGDLGVCWRLAADLADRGQHVRLWVDDASALGWMAPNGHPRIELKPWADPEPAIVPAPRVIEAFGCDPMPAFVARMAALGTPPVWINLEYLSAEPYVERSHGLSSPQWSGPGAGLVKWFFYPGFTPQTGGLLRNPGPRHVPDLPPDDAEPLRIVLFSYVPPALPGFLDSLACPTARPARVHVTPGFSRRAVEHWLSEPLGEGQSVRRGPLELFGQPHLPQPEWDRLLCRSDLNLVRGEDSLVCALWAGRPFLWQLYPQDDLAHHAKLQAFLDVYLDAELRADPAVDGWRSAFEAWNGVCTWDAHDWHRWLDTTTRPALRRQVSARADRLAHAQADLTTALMAFAQEKSTSASPRSGPF